MATFTPTKAGTIKAEVRQQTKGHKPIRITRTFDTMREAKAWAASAHEEINHTRKIGRVLPTNITLGEALKLWWSDLQAYVDDDNRRGEDHRARWRSRVKKIKSPLKFWSNHPYADLPFRDIGQVHLEQFIDEHREDDYSESTIRNKLYLLSALWDHAAAATLIDGPTGWNWKIDNPTWASCKSRRLAGSRPRDRRLSPNEHDAILDLLTRMRAAQLAAEDANGKKPFILEIPGRPALTMTPHPSLAYIPAAFLAAIESAMRRAKLFEIQWSWLDWKPDNTVDIVIPPQARKVKNKKVPTRLAASPDLRRILLQLNGADQHGRPIPKIGDALKERIFGPLLADRAYRLLVIAANALGITDLHWHDLRHEACSRLADAGWTTIQIQMVSGHTTLQSLERYTHASTSSVHALFAASEARKQAAIAALSLQQQPPPDPLALHPFQRVA